MVSNEGKEILRGIGLLAEHIICAADSYGEVSDKRKVVNDISETAARVKNIAKAYERIAEFVNRRYKEGSIK